MIDPASPDFTLTPDSDRRPRFTYRRAGRAAPPVVSVVTPFFDVGEVFHETARSVMGQSLQQWEWIIVNDGSTDTGSLAVLDFYRGRDPRIHVLDLPENRGPGSARNAGFRAARSPYIALVDADDLLEPTALEKWAWHLETHPESAFVKGFSVGFGAQNYLWTGGFHSGREFLRDNRADTSSLMRSSVPERIGGYDESMREGLEDWEFWLHSASAGLWGTTIPEYLNWYRRRPAHTDRWTNWDEGGRQGRVAAMLRERYPALWDGGFPEVPWREPLPNDWVPDSLPFENRLQKPGPRLLMIVPWMTTGGADKFNLDLVEQLTGKGWQITLAATAPGDNSWLPQFTRFTPDIFVLDHLVPLAHQPRFLRYLIGSRRPDLVLVTHSEMGYLLLPYLRSHFPEVPFVDYCHIVEEYWKNGGYPRMAVENQDQLDLMITASHQIKDWMIGHGAEEDKLRVCPINVDIDRWRPDPARRDALRAELGVTDETPIILFAGRLIEQKQPAVLAKTLLRLRREGHAFLAIVAGDGPEASWLQGFLRHNRLEDVVRWVGTVSNSRVQELMLAADVFFLPSRWEGIALVLYEAMASGLAVVGSDVGGQRELVSPESGILIEPVGEQEEIERYAQILGALLNDPTARRSIGLAGRERVAALFPIAQMGDRMAGLLREAQARHHKQSSPAPSVTLGGAIASQAVEYIRLAQVADQLWNERPEHSAVGRGQPRTNWRSRLYSRLYRWHEPIYRWYSRHGLDRWSPVREWTKRWILKT